MFTPRRQQRSTGTWPRRLAAALAGLLVHQGAAALGTDLEHYNHSIWTRKDGLPAQVDVMAQTRDGWLWLGTRAGLYRFDGLRFHPPAIANGGRLLSQRINVLRADANGDLLIGYEDQGLSVLRADGRIDHLAPAGKDSPVNLPMALVRDPEGVLWAGTSRGLMRLEAGRWTRMGPAQGYPEELTTMVSLDGEGRLWAATLGQLFRYERATRRFVQVALPALRPGEPPVRFQNLAMSPDGRLWHVEDGRVFRVPAAVPAAGRPPLANPLEGAYSGLFDREGHFWGLHCPTGVCLIPDAGAIDAERIDVASSATSRFDQAWQLGSLKPRTMLEDREGNIWLGSPSSLERFRRDSLTPVALPVAQGTYHLAPDVDGTVWIVAPTGKRGWHYDPATRRITELPGNYRSAARGVDGSVVMLTEDGIRRRRAGVEDRIALPYLPPGAWLRTDGERLWLGGSGVPVRVWDGRGWETLDKPAPTEFTFSAAGRQGQMWRALVDGRLLLFEHARITREYDQAALGGIGQATCLSALPELVVCGEAGVAAWDGRRFRRLQAARPDLLRNVSGVLATADGTRWLNGGAGLLRVEAADWRRALEDGTPLRAAVLDALDGYRSAASESHSLTMVGNRLWVQTGSGVLEIDPASREYNRIAPQVALLGLSGDGTAYPLAAPRIRAGTTRVRFDFTAPVLRMPERVRFSYRLDGVDDAWQSGTERSATYTGLAPGAYRFRVRAMNEDGVWSADERTLDFEVAPTIVQTAYFKLACVLGALLLMWLGYRLRIRYLTRRITERVEIKLAERERIARTLHDSFLQTVYLLLLRLRKFEGKLPEHEGARQELRGILQEAQAVMDEGRDQVHDLRLSPPRAIEEMLQDCVDRLRVLHPGVDYAFRRRGTVAELDQALVEEAGAIACEAVRNAFTHAQARHIAVEVDTSLRELTLTVHDDGKGMDSELLGAGSREGHWGLVGMRERAGRIGAALEIQSDAASGTTVRLSAPLAQAATGRAA